jgi:hypothetical protein
MATSGWRAQLELEEGRTGTKIMLPNIKMRPKEMLVIGQVLSGCDQGAREVFVFLVEQWESAGQIVGTTPQSIALDVRCGRAKSRIAVLLAGSPAS